MAPGFTIVSTAGISKRFQSIIVFITAPSRKLEPRDTSTSLIMNALANCKAAFMGAIKTKSDNTEKVGR